ncbi:hypothetical protein D0865_16161 [Hortaea werneckii]|uniref:Uncharacterized protein n=1 Tax=Hortaea werneckii TaxID=91943 RepID=A0A3M7AHF9_HORWE|nr:hypothetical protein D0865_16161 [Hortaea werneckii]
MRVLAATRNLGNLQKIACTTCAMQPGLNSTYEIDVTTQARQCPLKAVEDDERPMEWSDTEFILGLALNAPNITHIDADCSSYHLLGDTKSFDLLFPEGKCSKVRKGKKIYGEDWVKGQIFDQLNLQLTSLTFRVRVLEVEPTLLTIDWCLDDNDPSTRTEVLEYASVFKAFVLQHIKTLEICVVDSIVSTSEYQLNILAEGLKEFSAAGKNARMCLRTYACKPPAVQGRVNADLNGDLLKALRIVMETE